MTSARRRMRGGAVATDEQGWRGAFAAIIVAIAPVLAGAAVESLKARAEARRRSRARWEALIAAARCDEDLVPPHALEDDGDGQ